MLSCEPIVYRLPSNPQAASQAKQRKMLTALSERLRKAATQRAALVLSQGAHFTRSGTQPRDCESTVRCFVEHSRAGNQEWSPGRFGGYAVIFGDK